MTNEAKHTPTYPGVIAGKTTLSVDGGFKHYGWSTVVRAVNAHERLVGAIETACERLDHLSKRFSDVSDEYSLVTYIWSELENALAKAEGRNA